jgi:hypothetical protein
MHLPCISGNHSCYMPRQRLCVGSGCRSSVGNVTEHNRSSTVTAVSTAVLVRVLILSIGHPRESQRRTCKLLEPPQLSRPPS